jgi:hypothetical protein
MDGGEFSVYKMPDLRPYAPGTEAIFEPPPPLLCMIPRDKAYPLRYDYMCRTDLHDLSLPGPSLCVDVVGVLENHIPTLARFDIPIDFFAVESADQIASKSIVPILIHPVEERDANHPGWTSSWCDHNRLVYNLQYSPLDRTMKVMAHLTATDSNLGLGRWGNLFKCDWQGGIVMDYGLCLTSGRLCVVTPDEILIVDYVKALV